MSTQPREYQQGDGFEARTPSAVEPPRVTIVGPHADRVALAQAIRRRVELARQSPGTVAWGRVALLALADDIEAGRSVETGGEP